MKLYRYLLVRFQGKLGEWSSRGRSTHINGVQVHLHPRVRTDKWQLVTASTELEHVPPLDEQDRILIPDDTRERCELAAEHMINLISVLESSPKHITSPNLCVALGPANDAEREFLAHSRGMLAGQRTEQAAQLRIEWSPELGQGLADRMNGVALLSEALSAGSEGAQYREFGRFLELAFGLALYNPRLKTALVTYFDQSPGYGYDSDEIAEWVTLRHPTTHADLQRTNWIALSADVRHVVLRMRQACLDILFNKVDWHNPSNNRRRLWQPDAITNSKNGNMVVKAGTKDLSTLLRVFDEFGVYPRILEVVVDHSKDGLYAQFAEDAKMGGTIAKHHVAVVADVQC